MSLPKFSVIRVSCGESADLSTTAVDPDSPSQQLVAELVLARGDLSRPAFVFNKQIIQPVRFGVRATASTSVHPGSEQSIDATFRNCAVQRFSGNLCLSGLQQNPKQWLAADSPEYPVTFKGPSKVKQVLEFLTLGGEAEAGAEAEAIADSFSYAPALLFKRLVALVEADSNRH